jgi:hypothetical protein
MTFVPEPAVGLAGLLEQFRLRTASSCRTHLCCAPDSKSKRAEVGTWPTFALRKKASAMSSQACEDSIVVSKFLARPRARLSHPNVRSTTPRFGNTMKPLIWSI